MTILTVGAGQQFATLASAITASHDGDTIQVQAGTYTNDFAEITSRITIEGVGGPVHLVANEQIPNGKGILVTDTDITLKNLDFSGATVADGNGAGIRYQGGNLVLENCSFEDNQNGLLSAPDPNGSITIDGCTFDHNGSGSGNTHNLYVGAVGTLTITNSTFTDAVVGHEIKSRAYNNIIENNVIEDGPTGTASYSIDLPDGGNAIIQGNTIEKGPHSQNSHILHFGGEGLPYVESDLQITGNTIINDSTYGQIVGLLNNTQFIPTISGNHFEGNPLWAIAEGPAIATDNIGPDGQMLPDSSQTTPLNSNTATVYSETDLTPHTLTFTASGQAVQGGGGLLTVTTQAGHQTVYGGSGGLDYTTTGGGDTLGTEAGSSNHLSLGWAGDSVTSAGNDVIDGGTGNNFIGVTGSATVHAGTGHSQYQVTGTLLLDGVGADSVAVGKGAMLTASTTGWLDATELGGTVYATITDSANAAMGAEAVTVTGGSAEIQGHNGLGQVNITTGLQGGVVANLGASNAFVTTNGADSVLAGSGSTTVQVRGAGAQIQAGSGSLAVYTYGGTATVQGGTGPVTINGGGAGITFQGGDAAESVALMLGSTTLLGGAGHLTLSGAAGRQSIVGGSGGIDLNTTGGADVVSTAAGSSNTLVLGAGSQVMSAGTDVITMGSGNNHVSVSGATTIEGGDGHSAYTLSGQDVLHSHGSSDTVQLTAGAQATVTASGYVVVRENGAALAFAMDNAADGDATVTGGSATLLGVAGNGGLGITTGGGQGSAITLGGGNDTVSSQGSDTIQAGAGASQIGFGHTGTGQLLAGSGNLTVNSLGASLSVQGGGGALTLTGWGSTSIQGGSGDSVIRAMASLNMVAGTGNVTLTGGYGQDSFVAGSGNAVVDLGRAIGDVTFGSGHASVNGLGADTYRFLAGQGGGVDVISGFNAQTDHLVFGGVSIASQTAGAGALNLTLSDGTSVILLGLTALPGTAVLTA